MKVYVKKTTVVKLSWKVGDVLKTYLRVKQVKQFQYLQSKEKEWQILLQQKERSHDKDLDQGY